MGLQEKLMEDYKQAMREKNVIKKSVLNYLLAQLKNKQIDLQKELKEEDVVQAIKKEIKTRNESISYLEKTENQDELQEEQEKVEILEAYLPEMMSENDLRQLVERKIVELGVDDLRTERGKIIGSIMGEFRVVVDGKLLNDIINDFIDNK